MTFTPGGSGIWSTAQEVTVTAINDNIDNTGGERVATITHTLTVGSSDYSGVEVSDVEVTVTDDDGAPGGITLSVNTGGQAQMEIGEGAGATTVTVTATVTGGSTYATAQTVAVNVSGNSAKVGDDYTTSTIPFNIVVPAGANSHSGTFTLTPVDDDIHEGSETISVSGTIDGVGAPTVTGTTITITDNDVVPTALTLRVDADTGTDNVQTSLSEGGGVKTVRVTATLDGSTTFATNKTVSVEVGKLGDSAAEGMSGDYETVGTQSITIMAGESSGHVEFTLTPVNDLLFEGSETITIAGTLMGVSVRDTEITLEDDETVPAVSLLVDPNAVSESGGTRTVTVSAQLDPTVAMENRESTVTLSLGGTATSGDYTSSWSPVTPVITFPTGETKGANTVSLALTPTDDSSVEDDETVVVEGTATADDGQKLVVKVAVITLEDDDAQGINLSPRSVNVTEGATVTYDVWLGTQPTGDVTVTLSGHDTGIATVDKTELTFTNTTWNTRQQVAVTGDDDNLNNTENNRKTSIRHAAAGGGYNNVESTLDITVVDNDDAPSFSIDDASATEGQVISFTVNRAGATGHAVSVSWQTEEDTGGSHAASTSDYTVQTTPQVLNFAVGETSKTITVQTTQDNLTEEDETFLVKLSAPGTGTTITDDTATGRITNDDATPTALTLTVDADTGTNNVQTSLSEGGGAKTVRVTATLDGSIVFDEAKAVRVEVGHADDTAIKGTDYTMVGSLSITIDAESSSGYLDFTLTPVNDDIDESNETISFDGELEGVTVNGAVITLIDDDTKGVTVSAASSGLTLRETNDPDTDPTADDVGTYTVVFTSEPTGDVTINIGVPAGAPFTVSDTSIDFTPSNWSNEQTITVTAANDNIDNTGGMRSAEITHTVDAGNSDYGGVTADNLAVTVTDDDDTPGDITLTVDTPSITEGGGAKTVRVTATLDGSIVLDEDKTVSVDVGTGGDTAIEGTDYTMVGSQSITIDARSSSGHVEFTLTPTNDALDEENETITIEGTATDVVVTGTEITLTDDDTKGVTVSAMSTGVTIRETDVSGTPAEEHKITYTVVLTSKPTGTVTINIESGDTDVATVSPASLTFTPSGAGIWSTAQEVTVTAVNDNTDNTGDERSTEITHMLVAGTSDYGSVTVDDVSVTVTDDDGPPGGIALSVDTDTSMAGEQDEIGEDAGATTVEVTATVTGGSAYSSAQTVAVSVSDGTATVTDDYATVAGFSITIPAGTTSATHNFTLTPVNDMFHEGPETVNVSGTVSGAGAPAVTGTTITITDNDAAPTTATLTVDADTGVANNQNSLAEDGGAKTVRVTATLGGSVTFTGDKTVTVEVGNTGDTATEGTDYTMVVTQSITIKAGSSSGYVEFTLTPTQDIQAEGSETISFKGTATGLTVTDASITLTDDDTAPTTATLTVDADTGVANNQNSLAEDGGAKTVRVTATLGGSVTFTEDKTVSVEVGNSGDTAIEGTDYTTVGTQSITITAGSSSGYVEFTLTPTQDIQAEGSETISFKGTATGLTVTDASITLTDDDTAPTTATLTVDADTGVANNQNSLAEDGGAKTVRVTATLGGSVTFTGDKTVSVEVGNSGDTAIEGTDYTTVGTQSITITAGSSSGYVEFTLTPTQDIQAEGSETISIEGTSNGLTITPTAITMTDDDEMKGVTVSASSSGLVIHETDNIATTQTEEHKKSYTVVLDSVPTANVVIGVVVPEGAPFSVSPSSLTFTPSGSGIWSTEQTVTVTAINDDIDNTGGERVAKITHTLTVGSSNYQGISVPEVEVTVTDDDATPTTLALSVDTDTGTNNVQTSIAEGGGSKTVRVTATLGGTIAFDEDKTVSVEIGKSSDSAMEGTDYTVVGTQNIVIAAGSLSGFKDFTMTPTQDLLVEGNELISLDGTLAGVAVTDAIITLTDDDVTPSALSLTVDADMEISNIQTAISEGDGSMTVRVTATLVGTNAFTEDKTVSVEIGKSSDSATEGVDYTTIGTQSITITAGTLSAYKDLTLTPIQDTEDEGIETISVMGNLADVIVSPTNITLIDDDVTTITLAGAKGDIKEGQTKVFTIQLGRGLVTGETVTIPLTFAGTATRNSDYTLTGTTADGAQYNNLNTGNANVVFTGPNIGQTATTATITLSAAADQTTESAPETVDIGLGTITNTGLTNTGGVSKTDNLMVFNITENVSETENWIPKKAANKGLIRFGRTVGQQAASAIRDRLDTDRTEGFVSSLAGENLPHITSTPDVPKHHLDYPGTRNEHWQDDGRLPAEGLATEEDEITRALTDEDFLSGTSFTLNTVRGNGSTYSYWGRGSISEFRGVAEDISLDGEVKDIIIGTERIRHDRLLGLLIMGSRGDITYSFEDENGLIKTSLTSLVPYGSLDLNKNLSFWGAVGIGWGSMTLTPGESDPINTKLDWNMTAGGLEGTLSGLSILPGADLGWHTDALWTHTRSEHVEALPKIGGYTTRYRLGIEATWTEKPALNGFISPHVGIGVRYDGGDAERGFGLEISSGLTWTGPERNLSISVEGHTLAVHEEGDFRDWGLTFGLAWDPHPETKEGFSANLGYDLGNGVGKDDVLLGPETYPEQSEAVNNVSWQSEMAYGISQGGGMVGSSYGGLGGTSDEIDKARVGYRIEPDTPNAENISVDFWTDPVADDKGTNTGAEFIWRW